ncbi:hypothetical protein KDL45_17070, partial [bacterium]|nr:hypothetical protein [bacterium]
LDAKALRHMAGRVSVDLPDRAAMTFDRVAFERRDNGVLWRGEATGDAWAQAQITLVGDDAAGFVQTLDAFYVIRPLGGGVHGVHRVDADALGGCGVDSPAENTIAADDDDDDSADDDTSDDDTGDDDDDDDDEAPVVDVMMLYDAAAEAESGNIESEIRAAVDDTNLVYENSGVAHRIRLVHLQKVDYEERTDVLADKEALRIDGDGLVDEAHELRDDYGADLVGMVVTSRVGLCGYADLPLTVNPANHVYAFSVTSLNCLLSWHLFAHELGHNFSARHDRFVDPTDNQPFAFNHGYVNLDEKFRTVMAYDQQCNSSGFSCEVAPYFSNPDLTYNGHALGIPETEAKPTDNRKTLNLAAPTLAGYRETVVDSTTSTTTTTTIPGSDDDDFDDHTDDPTPPPNTDDGGGSNDNFRVEDDESGCSCGC